MIQGKVDRKEMERGRGQWGGGDGDSEMGRG